ncbi:MULTISPECIES: UbiA prenyltransferase family protein [Micromonospora]|uniref:4-hydroxybenzoate polyprenyltransferase n=1 Tax=Micromonospora yangpuensis TaxID=683228 RepID=A0A1C6UA16_9ACTN|nr:UbiA prenyltransferase family protein [Micromonospora yangpuensis]GGL88025.1 decaprenyl-phosphate phosphoribosyltransferase [Micromonospora yangpuensis]SCL50808.1 4-hydroxybenzoate polyprenyltransferase [Micromonospora yangpuensis]
MTVLVDPPTLGGSTLTNPVSRTGAVGVTGATAARTAVTGATTDRTPLRDLVTLIRPHQWAKNLLVVPLVLIDSPRLGLDLLGRVAWAVLLFIMVSALVYVWNDVYDRHRDRAHPTKRHRPVASGRVSVPAAYTFGGLIGVALVAAVSFGPAFPWWPLAVYLALNVAYSRGLKHVPLLDVLVVAGGFLLRITQGYLAAQVAVSSWLLISVFALCLLLILGKRRHEMAVGGSSHRPALAGYSVQYLDLLIVLCAAVTVSGFLGHVQATVPTPYQALALVGSMPFAMFAMARYLQVVVVDGDGGEPTRVLLRDRAMLVNSLLWGVLLGGTLLVSQYPAVLDLVP